jgi:HSP20 family molecular chaperone IbpA
MNNDESITHRDEARSTNGHGIPPVAPPCDVYENADEYLVVADMPGVEENAIDIKLDRAKLTIVGRRDSRSNGTVLESEPRPRVYLRTFQVPDAVDAAQIKAELERGVLTVHLPKGPQARVRKIAVTAG